MEGSATSLKGSAAKDLQLVVIVTVGFSVGLIAGYYFPANTYTADEIAHHHVAEHHRVLGSNVDPRVVSNAPIIHPPPAKFYPRLGGVQQHEFPPLASVGPKPQFQVGVDKAAADAAKAAQAQAKEKAEAAAAANEAKKADAELQRKYPPIGTPTSHEGVVKHLKAKYGGDTIHTLFTSNGSPYQNIQARIMYASYKMVQAMPGGDKLTGFTRILHRTKPDIMMELGEIPSFRAEPLQAACDHWCEFPVSDRANAVRQWVEAAEKQPDMVQGAWLLLLESDYVWMKPLQALGSAYDRTVPGIGFRFDYIDPQYPTVVPLIRRMCPTCDYRKVPGTGPAPVLIRFEELKRATPDWEALSQWIEDHADAKKQLGWVREMYAWSVSVAKNKVPQVVDLPPKSPLISQLPHDWQLGNASMFHYTWGILYHNMSDNKEIWHFDKRFLTDYKLQLKVPELPMPPKYVEGQMKLLDGLRINPTLHAAVEQLMSRINEVVRTLPDLSAKAPPQT